MKRIPLGLAGAALIMMLAGCAGHAARSSGDLGSPSASVGDEVRPFAGRWQGALTETGGFYYAGYAPLDLVLESDGTWTGTIGKARAQGTARMNGDRLVLRGSSRGADGHEDPVYATLAGDDARRWAETLGRFGGRQERASIALKKVR
jgi:hypothetical protein